MTWDPVLATKNQRIDDYHKKICEQIDLLIKSPDATAALKVMSWLFTELSDHFRDEEKLMAATSEREEYPEILRHSRAHAEGYDTFVILRARVLKSIREKAPEQLVIWQIANFITALEHWLYQHVFDEDKRFARWLLAEEERLASRLQRQA